MVSAKSKAYRKACLRAHFEVELQVLVVKREIYTKWVWLSLNSTKCFLKAYFPKFEAIWPLGLVYQKCMLGRKSICQHKTYFQQRKHKGS